MFKVYSTTTCAKCQMVKKFLSLNEQEYEEINLDEQPNKREDVLKIANGMTAVPVVTKIENDTETLVCIGWNPQSILKAL